MSTADPSPAAPPRLRLRVNGEPREVVAPATVADLLAALGVPRTHTAVERNRQIVPKPEFERVALADGDVLEIVTLVGGG
ncbi:MAG: sulfur carrier protein ThiS [Planctomycetes bacterium]|nr:sulfur carrier protein ThiS [Planctomycetota bacterium]